MEADKYEVLEKIGQGSFGIIRKVRRKADGHVLCRKEISYLRMSSKEREQLQSELVVLKGLRHPNIVAYYEREHIKTTQDLHIYMEYCESGDLAKRIKHMLRNNLMAEEDFVWSVFAQLVTALYRCHYGEDPPEVGRNVIGLGNDAHPIRSKASHTMILHRDLKPENIFLGADSSVKLGDFGLSKIMASHDFASTYVGTPFYMSPEICAAEQYSLFSDIWAFGCIMYELCAKEPPFNAKTHLELIQKIRLGRVKPLSAVYSQQLQDTIQSCLKVNPQLRPDTAQLLNLPMVKLKRKEMEVVALGKQMKIREELANRKVKEMERQLAVHESWRDTVRAELDNSLRREWEVKARLEIDRQVQTEMHRLQNDFEVEVARRVAEEVTKRLKERQTQQLERSSTPDPDDLPDDLPFIAEYQQSQSTTGDTEDFASYTDLSELSIDSPTTEKSKPLKKSARTPFTRAHTMFEGSPMDVQMADPSPASIASLGLSPRRSGNKPSQLSRNIFAVAANSSRSNGPSPSSMKDIFENAEDDDDGDHIAAMPSPTRAKRAGNDPFQILRGSRPALLRQKTAPLQKLGSQPTLFGGPSANRSGIAGSKEGPIPQSSSFSRGALSPNRRQTKLPSSTALIPDTGSPLRKAPPPPTSPSRLGTRPLMRAKTEDVRQVAMLNNHVQGRTLVELAQARIPLEDAALDVLEEPAPRLRKALSDGSGVPSKEVLLAAKIAGERPHSLSAASTPLWDPERDEMPSPFLARGGRNLLPGTIGGPGMKHLR